MGKLRNIIIILVIISISLTLIASNQANVGHTHSRVHEHNKGAISPLGEPLPIGINCILADWCHSSCFINIPKIGW